MTTMPRVLVGITTYDQKDYMLPKCYKAVREFDYPKDSYDVMIVDNTDDKGRYMRKMKRRGWPWVERVSRGANSRVALTKSQNLIRARFLEGDYDYLLLVESDLLPPPDSIKRLMAYGKPVVGSTYFIGHEVKVPCIFLSDVKVGGLSGTRPIGMVRSGTHGKYTRHNQAEVDAFLGTGLRKIHGCGFGCTLIRRDIVERFPFWCDERFDNKHSDVYFYLDMERHFIPVYVDTNVIVPHFPTRWDDVHDR